MKQTFLILVYAIFVGLFLQVVPTTTPRPRIIFIDGGFISLALCFFNCKQVIWNLVYGTI